MPKNYFKFGDFNRICDWSGFKVKASRTVKTWDNWIVRPKDWDPRHPQEFLRGVPDLMAAPEPRPEPKSIFTGSGVILCQDPVTYGYNAILQENSGFILTDGDLS